MYLPNQLQSTGGVRLPVQLGIAICACSLGRSSQPGVVPPSTIDRLTSSANSASKIMLGSNPGVWLTALQAVVRTRKGDPRLAEQHVR